MSCRLWSIAGRNWEKAPEGAEPDVEIECAGGEVRRYHACVLVMASPTFFGAGIRFKRQQQQPIRFDLRDKDARLIDYVTEIAYQGTAERGVNLSEVLIVARTQKLLGFAVTPPPVITRVDVERSNGIVDLRFERWIRLKLRREDDAYHPEEGYLECLNDVIGDDVVHEIAISKWDVWTRHGELCEVWHEITRITINGVQYDNDGTSDWLSSAFSRAVCASVDQ